MSAKCYEFEELKEVIEIITETNEIVTLEELFKYLEDNNDKCYCAY